jgi:hypothetical protein
MRLTFHSKFHQGFLSVRSAARIAIALRAGVPAAVPLVTQESLKGVVVVTERRERHEFPPQPQELLDQ